MGRSSSPADRAGVAAMREQAHRDRQRRRNLRIAVAAVAAVVVVLGGLVVAKLAGVGSPRSAAVSTAAGTPSAAVLEGVTSVPVSVLDTVGVGSAQNAPTKVSAPALVDGTKQRVLYIGAEYCPYCAAQRWPLVVALARFGTWTGLRTTTSASDDVFPDTPTLSFHGASFSSDVVTFNGYEQLDRDRKPLDTLPAADSAVLATFDAPPYVPADAKGSIPFLDIGGVYIASGASFSSDLLAGKSHEQIATALSDPRSDIARAVDGSANAITAAICDVTGGKPASVCTASGVTAAKVTLATKK